MKIIKYFSSLSIPQKTLGFIMAVFGCIFFTTVIGNHYYFRTYAFDYAVHNFAFWDYSHLHITPVPCWNIFNKGPITFMQDHFSLLLMYLVPLYWLLSWLTGTYTLLIIVVLFILLSGWAIYRLIKLKTNDEWLAVISVLYYFLLQGRYSSLGSENIILTICCCLVPLFLLCFELKKYVFAFIIFILLLFSREDMPLWFIFIFMVLIIWHWKEKKIVAYCITGILTSIVYFIFLFKVFIPMVETSNTHYELFQYSALGKTPSEALLHIIKHPIETLKLLYINPLPDHGYDKVKREFYLVYFISGGILLFLRPQYFIWFIPLIAQKVFNDEPVRWGIASYYSITIVALLPISIFLIISKFKIKWIRYSLSVIVCILAFSITWYKMNINNRVLNWGTTTKENIFDSKFFHPDYDASKIHADLKLIPADAKVSASSLILPHLSQRRYAYEFPDVEDADYLAVFTFHDYYLYPDTAYARVLNQYICSPSWAVIANDAPFLLMKKTTGGFGKKIIVDSFECGAEAMSPGKLHFIASNGELLDNADVRDSVVKHNGNYSICLNHRKPYGFTYHGVNFKPGDFLKITVWKYPASEDNGQLMVTCGKDFSETVIRGNNKKNLGWEQLEMYVIVPENNSDFLIYLMNNSPANVWFDDLRIVHRPFK